MPRACAVALLLLLLLAGCGEPYAPAPLAADLHGHSDPRPEPARWNLALPEARHASEDHEGDITRLIVNLLAEGELLLKGNFWRLASGTAEERESAMRAFAEEMSRLTNNPDLREVDGTSRIPLLFNADREARWRSVRVLWLRMVRDPAIRVREFQWAVWWSSVGTYANARQEARVTEASAPEHALRVVLQATDGSARPAVDLAIGEHRWSFGALVETPYEDAEFLARSNQVWNEAEAALSELARPDIPVAFRIVNGEQDLPWAFVVKVFDLLLGAGVREVFLVEEGLRLELSVPTETRPRGRNAAPVVTPGVLVACGVAVLLAFAIAFSARPRRRGR